MNLFRITSNTNLEALADSFLEKVLSKENFSESSAKGGFLTGGNIIVCESKGLQEYLKKRCVDKHGIWTALPFKPLAGTLMQFAYNLSDKKKDEKNCVYNQSNLIWAIYNLFPKNQMQKTFSFANELASLFSGYQIYRSDLIEAWNENRPYDIKNDNAEWQRELWKKLKEKYKDEQDISQLYKAIKENNSKIEKKRIFIFAPLSMPPIHLDSLKHLAIAGCEVNLYLHLISSKYIGEAKSDKSITYLRKISWENKIVPDEDKLYWDLGNRLIANLGRSAQVLYEQIGWDELESIGECRNMNSLLEKIQADIINDENEKEKCEKDDTIIFNNCFSPLREIEVLCDYILDLFAKDKKLSPTDIAVVSPNIEPYASAIEMVFGRYKIPYKIADRDVKKHDKTVQLLNLLFSQVGVSGRYGASDIVALFEYSKFVRDEELDSNDRERLEKWVRENAIRHGLESPYENGGKPDYSFESGFDQLAAGFLMISETEFSAGKEEYCYPDIEGSSAGFLGDFVHFVRALKKMEEASKKEKSITDWDEFFRENLQVFFGKDETNFNEEDNPYQEVIGAWDSLKEEILTGFGNEKDTFVDFSVIKSALLKKMDINAKSSYSLSGNISFSNLETIMAVPHKVICCIGMNGKEFPRQTPDKEISLMAACPRDGDKDTANEDRLMFLRTICSAKKALYISWVGQDEKSAELLEPSSVVVMLLKNLEEQYEVKEVVAKHPLQPFSRRYFNGELSTYDNRWKPVAGGQRPVSSGSGRIWEWEIDSVEIEEKRDIEDLYKILSDTPKYFLRDVCNIELPEDIELLENLEPFVVEKGLEEWKLADLILKKKDIRIAKLRGELPSGKFADKIIENAKKEIEELRKRAEDEISGTFWIYPSEDKGKYRLKHWLYHLDLNLKKKANTKMFLKDNTILLPEMPRERAKEILDKLWNLKRELEKRMLPIFPNAAWEYINNPKDLSNAWKKLDSYSQYAKMAIGNAQSFKDLGIEEKFIEYSRKLFENYNGVEVENEKD